MAILRVYYLPDGAVFCPLGMIHQRDAVRKADDGKAKWYVYSVDQS